MMERFSKLLLGEDMSGSGKGVCTALAISNAITNLCGMLSLLILWIVVFALWSLRDLLISTCLKMLPTVWLGIKRVLDCFIVNNKCNMCF